VPTDGKIDYPSSGKARAGNNNSFAAFGCVDRKRHPKVRCVLFHADGTSKKGHPLVRPDSPFWAVAFSGVRVEQHCRLELQDTADDCVIDCISDLDVTGGGFDTEITYPHASDNPIPQNFIAWGGTSGTVTGGTMNAVADSGVFANGSSWFVTFQGVPVGNGYTLTVSDGSSGGVQSRGLNVA